MSSRRLRALVNNATPKSSPSVPPHDTRDRRSTIKVGGKQQAAQRWRRLQSLIGSGGGRVVLPQLSEDELTVIEQVYGNHRPKTIAEVAALAERVGLPFRERGLLKAVLDYVGFVEDIAMTPAQFQRLVQIGKHRLHIDSVVGDDDELNLRTFEALGGDAHGKGKVDRDLLNECVETFGLDLNTILIESPKLGAANGSPNAADASERAALTEALKVSSPGLSLSMAAGDAMYESDEEAGFDYCEFVASFMAGDPSASQDVDATVCGGSPPLGARTAGSPVALSPQEMTDLPPPLTSSQSFTTDTPRAAAAAAGHTSPMVMHDHTSPVRRGSSLSPPSPRGGQYGMSPMQSNGAESAGDRQTPLRMGTGLSTRRVSSFAGLDANHRRSTSKSRGGARGSLAHDLGGTATTHEGLSKAVKRHNQRLENAAPPKHRGNAALRGYVKSVPERTHGAGSQSLYARRMLRRKFEAEHNKKSGYIVQSNGNDMSIATRAGRLLQPVKHVAHSPPRAYIKWKEDLDAVEMPEMTAKLAKLLGITRTPPT